MPFSIRSVGSHLRSVVVVATVALACGCVVARVPSSSGDAATSSPYPNERQQLAEAEHALHAERWDDAARLAHEARRTLTLGAPTMRDGSYQDRVAQDAAWPVFNKLLAHAIAIEGTALRRKGDGLGAVLVLGNETFEEKNCEAGLRSTCDEYREFVYDDPAWKYLRGTQKGDGRWVFSDHLISFSDFVFGLDSLTTAELGSLPHHLPDEADYVAVWVTTSAATSVKSTKERNAQTYVLTGTPMSIGSSNCATKIGEVEIGDARFDVRRCQHSTTNYVPASLSFSLPIAEAERLTFDEGQRALVAFRRKNFRRVGGSTWTLGPARLARGGKAD
jgi:hypothetical protein